MSDYLLSQGTKSTPQSSPIPGSTQVANSAGGFAWEVDDWTKLRRFLILGAEGGSYYASERDLTTANAEALRRCVAADGLRVVREIVSVSFAGRAPKNEPALYALAVCISLGDRATRVAAGKALPAVARIGTHLFHFVAYAETMRGWGVVMRKAVANWYAEKGERLPYDAIKYRQRDGWSHRDLLRLSHPESASPGVVDSTFGFIAGSDATVEIPLLAAFIEAQASDTPERTAELVEKYNLPREALRPEHLSSPAVWEALVDAGMPMTALIRNLATLTRHGLLVPGSDVFRAVVAQLGDAHAIQRARVHPIAVLAALLTYRAGHGARGKTVWDPVGQIVDALDGAFYTAFGNVEKTGERYLLALDVSGSMDDGEIAGVPGLTPRVASAAMAMVTARVEDAYEVVAFTGNRYMPPGSVTYQAGMGYGFGRAVSPLPITPRQRLDDICRQTDALPFGGTDCSLPMAYALQHKREFDAFIVYTDSETWAGTIHPAQALREYRATLVPDAKLIVVGMVSNGFSIADPNDAGMLDVVGFDTATPNLIGGFAAGEI